MTKETTALLGTWVSVVVAVLAWLLPFRSVGSSPAASLVESTRVEVRTDQGGEALTQSGSAENGAVPATRAVSVAGHAVSTTTDVEINPTPASSVTALTSLVTDRRIRWVHDAGVFTYLGNSRWFERNEGRTFNFVELERSPSFIVMHDASRDCYVRLTESACDVKCMAWAKEAFGANWGHYYSGQWE